MGNDPVKKNDPNGGKPFDWYINTRTAQVEQFEGVSEELNGWIWLAGDDATRGEIHDALQLLFGFSNLKLEPDGKIYLDLNLADQYEIWKAWADATAVSTLYYGAPKGSVSSRGFQLLPRLAVAEGELITVGRWMSKAEYELMLATGRMAEGAGGQTFVTTAGASSFTAAAKGSVYIEFQVAARSLLQGGRGGWLKAIGPNASRSMRSALQQQGGQMLPRVKNISPILKTN